MNKSETVRGRVSDVLKKRLEKYISAQAARGKSISESDVLIDALVEYLDRQDEIVAANFAKLAGIPVKSNLNEPPTSYLKPRK